MRLRGSQTITVRTEPKGANVFVDGKRQGVRSPMRATMPGDKPHLVRLELDGFHAVTATVTETSPGKLDFSFTPTAM